MKVVKIQVGTARTLSMKGTCYQNVRPHVQFEAQLEKGEDFLEETRKLHQQAEEFMEDRCDELIAYAAFRSMKRAKKLDKESAYQPQKDSSSSEGKS